MFQFSINIFCYEKIELPFCVDILVTELINWCSESPQFSRKSVFFFSITEPLINGHEKAWNCRTGVVYLWISWCVLIKKKYIFCFNNIIYTHLKWDRVWSTKWSQRIQNIFNIIHSQCYLISKFATTKKEEKEKKSKIENNIPYDNSSHVQSIFTLSII